MLSAYTILLKDSFRNLGKLLAPRFSCITLPLLALLYFLITGGWMLFIGGTPQWEITNNYFGSYEEEDSFRVEFDANGTTDARTTPWYAPWQSRWESSSPYVIRVFIRGGPNLLECRVPTGSVSLNPDPRLLVSDLNFEPNQGVLEATGNGWFKFLRVGAERWASFYSRQRVSLNGKQHALKFEIEVRTLEGERKWSINEQITLLREVTFGMSF